MLPLAAWPLKKLRRPETDCKFGVVSSIRPPGFRTRSASDMVKNGLIRKA